jgi:hypothetical protein
MKMNFGYEEGNRPVGGVQFFPDSATSWVGFPHRSLSRAVTIRRAQADLHLLPG